MQLFESPAHAKTYFSRNLDVPERPRALNLRDSLQVGITNYDLGQGAFTNSYEVSYSPHAMPTSIHVLDRLTSVPQFARQHPEFRAVSNGGFFFLADEYCGSPRQLALNLSLAQGELRSLPLADKEAVVCRSQSVEVMMVRALGHLTLNGVELSWAGSLSPWMKEADVKVFGNGNIAIQHQPCAFNKTKRVLEASSCVTPPIQPGEVDMGLLRAGRNIFYSVARSRSGGLDLLGYDIVLRCPENLVRFGASKYDVVRVHTIGALTLGAALQGAISVGASLKVTDFAAHPLNNDRSLGDHSPLAPVRQARMILFKTADERMHLRLFDARPESESFVGVTPSEAAAIINAEHEVVEGCFLDSGQTAKLCVRQERVQSYGNRHYLQWPARVGDAYTWIPEAGRPVASVIAVG